MLPEMAPASPRARSRVFLIWRRATTDTEEAVATQTFATFASVIHAGTVSRRSPSWMTNAGCGVVRTMMGAKRFPTRGWNGSWMLISGSLVLWPRLVTP